MIELTSGVDIFSVPTVRIFKSLVLIVFVSGKLGDNPVCVENLDQSALSMLVYCTNGPMWGRYVVLEKGPVDDGKRWFLAEFKIFTLE